MDEQAFTKAFNDATPLKDAVEDIKKLPANEAGIGFVVEQGGNVGVTGQVYRPLANGWSFGVAGEWTRKTKGRIAGMLGFKW